MKARFTMFMAAVMVALGLTAMGSAAPASAATTCPFGAVCVYYGTTTGSGVKYAFFSYGAHNIYNMTGNHLVWNNQTNGAGAYAKSGANGGGLTIYRMLEGTSGYRTQIMNLSPIWSFTLIPRCRAGSLCGGLGG